MDVEKTMRFIVQRHTDYAAKCKVDRTRQLEADRKRAVRLNGLTSAVAALLAKTQADEASRRAFDAEWKDFLERFDRFLARQAGSNGRARPVSKKLHAS